jgi:hypothetical protein
MEHDPAQTQRSFLQAFFSSFVAFKDYPQLAQRSIGSAIAHFAVLVTLVCSLYAGLAGYWLKVNVDPFLQSTVAQLPEIHIKDGVASTNLPEPHVICIEKEPVFIIDTTADPKVHLDQYKAIVILSERHFTTKSENGTIESHELAGNFDLDSAKVNGWVEAAKGWVLPILFLCVAGWQFCWKSIQVLLVAGIVTLVNSSRPDFSTHFRLACYALSPAMAWGLGAFAAGTAGIPIPFAGLIFWCILFGVTASVAAKIKNSPKYS